jgi:hypothetical protein
MKKKIVALLVSIFIIRSLSISNVVALSLEDKPYFYDVQIDKEGEILGDGDTIDIFCSLAGFDGTADDCYCLINAYSSNIQVPLYYNEDTERYEGSYTFGKTYDNPTRACYIMLIDSYENGITTYFNEDTHPFGYHSFYYCNKCKDKIHYPVIDESRDPTCTDDGMTEGSHCSLCKTVIKAQETIPADGHAWDGGKITKEVTCKEDGVKTYICSVCKETKTETIAKLTTHTWDSGKITKEATCKEDGVKTYTCSVCKETKTETIAKLTTHTWDSGKITKEATCKEDGVKTYTCSVCKETKIESIAKLATHTPSAEATTTTPQICTVCGKELKPATGVTEPPAIGSTDELTSPKENENPENGEFPVVIVVAIVVLVVGIAASVIIWKKKN